MQTQKSLKDYPKRGEIYIANLNPSFGREIHKKRPVLIISNNNFNQTRPHVVIIPTSSIVPKNLTDDIVALGKLKGFDKKSVLLPLFIRSIDQDRLTKKIRDLPKIKLQKVEEALKIVLGIKEYK